MNGRRLRKQITYAGLFGLFWLVVIGGPVWLLNRGETPRTAPTLSPSSLFQPIEVQSVDVIQHAGTVDVVARLHNPNVRAGIVHYPVTFILLNAQDQEIARASVASHILPGSLQYLAALNIAVPEPVATVQFDAPDTPAYVPLSENITLPSFSTSLNERTTRQSGSTSLVEQKGIVTNNGTLDWQQVAITAVALAEDGRPVGVGTTFVGRLTSREQREFTIQWPEGPLPVARVVTLATTNIFKEDNIIRAVGDPNLLR